MKSVFRHPLAQRIALGAAGLAILSVVAVEPAHSQFGIDIAAILAGLKEVNSTLTSAVASPLKLIDKVEQEEQQFQQQVLYPIAAIDSARQMATNFSSSFLSFRQLGSMNIASAQLPYAKSIMDYLFRWLELRFLSGTQLTLFSAPGDHSTVQVDPGKVVPISSQGSEAGDAPACRSCGGLMSPNGNCYVCRNCGGTSGCS